MQCYRAGVTNGLSLELLVLEKLWAEVVRKRRLVARIGGEEPLFHGLGRNFLRTEPCRNNDVVGTCRYVDGEWASGCRGRIDQNDACVKADRELVRCTWVAGWTSNGCSAGAAR